MQLTFVYGLCLVAIIMVIFLLYFYRFPQFTLDPYMPASTIVSPAYGTILEINDSAHTVEIVIFLSPFDIHYQFYPIDGIVLDTYHDRTGKFELANYAGKSRDNEKQITNISTDYGFITIKQIAGMLVRRIAFYNKSGDKVHRGDTLGIIKFGSRVDVILPKPINLQVKKGDYVNGPETILGEFSKASPACNIRRIDMWQ